MSASGSMADRNLLFGILALQMDFVSKDALIAAMNAWVLDKAKPLGDHLASQGALKPDHHKLLEALVQAHLAQHGNDPARSLAALSTVDSDRFGLARVAIPDMQTILGLTPATAAADEANASPTRVHDCAPASRTRFHVLRPHALGGLGEVSVALDEELHREVALKEIQARFADNPRSRERFLLEAEVTGGLEHPGIVPVYGLGAYADGRPYYAMRFIRGESLKEALATFHKKGRTLARRDFEGGDFRQLLGRFLAVCNAIAYAHSRRVLHRDLKPGNIMLGKYGETLVVDWGLAKVLGPNRDESRTLVSADEFPIRSTSSASSSETQPGAMIGTPDYMSPEQAAGRWDVIGPASDVYSLGATLYTMLTGRTPVDGENVADVLHKVERGKVTLPRQVCPAVPPALEAVCRKALALRSGDRYASALDLAADIERWLADEPVAAYQEPLAVRVRRWGRRHRPLVAGAAALLVMAVVLLIALNVQSARARKTVEREQAQTAAERDAKEQERQKAEAARVEAEQQRDRASAARRRTREALDAMVSGVTGDALTTQKEISPEQRAFLQSVLKYYEEFAAEPGEDREGLERLAKAHFSLGRIRYRLGQAEEGMPVVRRCVELYEKLVADAPTVANYRRELARSLNSLGDLLASLGRRSDAEAAHRRAIDLCEKLAADGPDVHDHRQELARSLNNLGNLLARAGKGPEAEAAYRRAIELNEKLADDAPTVPRYREGQARSLTNLGSVLAGVGKLPEAEAVYRRAVGLYEKLATDVPAEPAYRQDLAASLNNLGYLLAGVGKAADARAAYLRAIELREKLAADAPGVPAFVVELGGTYCNFGNLLRAGEPADAVAWHSKAVERLAPVVAAEPRQVVARQFLLNTHWGRAADYVALRCYGEAVADWERALELDNGAARTVLRLRRADCLARLGRVAEATAAANEVVESGPPSADALYDAACIVSLSSAAAKDNTALADSYAARAVVILRHTFVQGYTDLAHMLQDEDLDPLRRRADYADLLWDLADTPAAVQRSPASPGGVK